MRSIKIALAAVFCALGIAASLSSAQADQHTEAWQPVSWQSTANGCVPTDDAAGNLDTLAGGGITLVSGVTGTYQLICPIQGFHGSHAPNSLYFTYRDSSGWNSSSHEAKAQLIRASRSGASPATIVTLDSDSYSDTGIVEQSERIAHTFDFSDYYYYVVITLKRANIGTTVSAYGVTLEYVIE